MYSGATIIGTHDNQDTTTIGTPLLAVIAVQKIDPRVPDDRFTHPPENGFKPGDQKLQKNTVPRDGPESAKMRNLPKTCFFVYA